MDGPAVRAGLVVYLERERGHLIATRRARLGTGEIAVNHDQRSPIPGRFVLQLAHQFSPAHITDCLGQRVIFQQVLDGQRLDTDRLVLTNQASRQLVEANCATGRQCGRECG